MLLLWFFFFKQKICYYWYFISTNLRFTYCFFFAFVVIVFSPHKSDCIWCVPNTFIRWNISDNWQLFKSDYRMKQSNTNKWIHFYLLIYFFVCLTSKNEFQQHLSVSNTNFPRYMLKSIDLINFKRYALKIIFHETIFYFNFKFCIEDFSRNWIIFLNTIVFNESNLI